MHDRRSLAGLAVLLGLLIATPAEAHKLKVFATAEGGAVSGYAYFFGGGRAMDTRVTVTDPRGRTLVELRTDAEGTFRFDTTQRQDYRTSTTISAADLPEPAVMADGAEMTLRSKVAEAAVVPPPVEPEPAMAAPDVATLVEAAVAHQIRPLREQVDAWSDRILVHDVLGGLGYILGLAGLAYGLTARRRTKAGPEASDG